MIIVSKLLDFLLSLCYNAHKKRRNFLWKKIFHGPKNQRLGTKLSLLQKNKKISMKVKENLIEVASGVFFQLNGLLSQYGEKEKIYMFISEKTEDSILESLKHLAIELHNFFKKEEKDLWEKEIRYGIHDWVAKEHIQYLIMAYNCHLRGITSDIIQDLKEIIEK